MRKKSLDNFIIPDALLKPGDRGMQVERLQICLDYILKYKGKKKLSSIEPAYFGSETRLALREFRIIVNIGGFGDYDALARQKLREAIECR